MKPRLRPHYSGIRSDGFWKRVNAVEAGILYSLACKLQKIEEDVLHRLRDAEEKAARARRVRKDAE
jgi:hypothetical protein